VSVCDGRGRPFRAPGLAAWLAAVAPARARGEVTVAFVGDTRMRTLNRAWRGADYATDVLSFPSVGPAEAGPYTGDGGPPSRQRRSGTAGLERGARSLEPERWTREPAVLGDIVIATGVAARQAREAGHSTAKEWRVLALHGLLHLLGYDHERDAGAMARVERRLRRKGGLGAGLIERGGA
jgi:probable rRNA maturation factor